MEDFGAVNWLTVVAGITATSNALITAILAILAVAVYVASMGGFIKKSRTAIVIDFSYVPVAGAVMIFAQGVLKGAAPAPTPTQLATRTKYD